MRSVILTCRVDDETGESGLVCEGVSVPDGQPLVATRGAAIAHDVLEHVNGLDRIGTVNDELEALGAIWYVRGQLWDLSRDGLGANHPPQVNIASDVCYMYVNAVRNGESVDAPRTKACDADADIDDILRIARKEILTELAYADSDEELDTADLDAYLSVARSRLRIGYRKAVKRYPSQREVNALFWAIADACKSAVRHCVEGQQFKLTYGEGRAYCEEFYGEDYDG